MNSWLIRPYKNGISRLEEFKTNNIVGIGWANTGNLTNKSCMEITTIMNAQFSADYSSKKHMLGAACTMMDLFVNRMSIGDYVLVPDERDIYFCEITSDYFYDESAPDNGKAYFHKRSVRWLPSALRSNLSEELRVSLKVPRVVADLAKHTAEIKALANGTKYENIAENNRNQQEYSGETIDVSYPIRKDFDIRFQIPVDLSKNEAKRLSMYFETLYFDK